MIRSIIKVALLLIVGILGYNYFFGSAEEKANSKQIINKVGDVGRAGVGLLKDEIGKFKAGKYDDSLDKIGNALNNTKEKVKEGSELLGQLTNWQEKKEEWTKKREELEESIDSDDEATQEETKKAIKRLSDEAEELEKEGKQLERKMEEEKKE